MLQIGIQQREHHQHSQAAEAPDKGQDQDKIGRERRKDEGQGPHAFTSVWHHPGSALSARTLLLSLPWLLVLVFQLQLAALAPSVLQLRGREGVRGQPALLSFLPFQQEAPDPSAIFPLCPSAGQSHTDTLHHRAAQKTSLRSRP